MIIFYVYYTFATIMYVFIEYVKIVVMFDLMIILCFLFMFDNPAPLPATC
jgi:hypothetical protein